MKLRLLAAAALGAALAASPARAMFPPNAPKPKPADPVQSQPAATLAVDVVEKLGAQVPLDLGFTGPDGKPVVLRDVLARGKPTVLALVYYECPMLCGLVLGGLATSMRQTGLELGKDYEALTVSFDPRETSRLAEQRQRTYLSKANATDRARDWPFLTGQEPEIRALTGSVGFGYAYDAETKQYAHAAVIVLLTPEGKVSRYLYGVDYPARDLRLGLVEAAEGRVGTAFDRVMLTCFRYDPASRRYAPYVVGFIKIASGAVLGALAVTLGVFWRREWQRSARKETRR